MLCTLIPGPHSNQPQLSNSQLDSGDAHRLGELLLLLGLQPLN